MATISGVEIRGLAKNSIWSLLGFLIPIATALVTIPILIRTLGQAKFGILALTWTIMGYSSLLDLGLGRAITRFIAQENSVWSGISVPRTVWTALVLLFVLGAVGGCLIAALSDAIWSALRIPSTLRADTVTGFRVLAIAVPWVTVTGGLRGILEGRQRFAILSIISCLLGIGIYAGPLLALRYSNTLTGVLAMLAGTRIASAVLHFVICLLTSSEYFSDRKCVFATVTPLFRFGGWITLSGILVPILTSVDRFVLSATCSVSQVAFYVSPFEAVTKILVIPGAICAVLFPGLSSAVRLGAGNAQRIYRVALLAIGVLVIPICLGVAGFAHQGLRFWLGTEFADNGAAVTRYLAIGVILNAFGFVPAAFLHAVGKPDVTAKLQIIQIPLVFLGSWYLIHRFGIQGAGLSWTIRVGLEAGILFILAGSKHQLGSPR